VTNLGVGGTGDAIVRGVGKASSLGFIDEIEGGMSYLAAASRNGEMRGEPMADAGAAYRKGRDQRRHDDEVSQKASPDAFGTAQFAKAFDSAALDTVEGGALGLATAGAIEPVAALGRYGKALKAQGKAGEVAAVGKAASKDFGKARGGLGSDTRGTITALKDADAIVARPIPPDMTGEALRAEMAMKEQARAFVESDLGKQTRQLAAQNMLDDLPNKMGQMQESRASMEAAGEAASPEMVEAAAQKNVDKSIITEDIAPRLDRLGHNTVFSTAASSIGAPLTTVKNIMKTPRIQYRAGQVIGAAGKPAEAMSKAQIPATGMLEDYLRPRDDEEREEQGATWLTSLAGKPR
jgi:hypothetical protein